jgi:hypothetical protein
MSTAAQLFGYQTDFARVIQFLATAEAEKIYRFQKKQEEYMSKPVAPLYKVDGKDGKIEIPVIDEDIKNLHFATSGFGYIGEREPISFSELKKLAKVKMLVKTLNLYVEPYYTVGIYNLLNTITGLAAVKSSRHDSFIPEELLRRMISTQIGLGQQGEEEEEIIVERRKRGKKKKKKEEEEEEEGVEEE